jgi:acetolactate synthase-1/2/3 large subunit
MPTVADLIVRRLVEAGVRTLVGMPGGGSNLDLVDAAGRAGLPFVLSHTETAGALIACAQAELSGHPGACLATIGPGVASLVNGAAHASLDRVPLLLLTDAMPAAGREIHQHQRVEHGALFTPVTKARWTLSAEGSAEQITSALALSIAEPRGPVHIDLAPDVSRLAVSSIANQILHPPKDKDSPALEDRVRELLSAARRPIVIAGLGVRDQRDADAIRALCERHNVPALVTYKAKGVIPDEHPLFAGVFTLGALERPVVENADLIIGVGLDPVEFLPRAWDYRAPVVSLSRWEYGRSQMPIAASIIGDLVVSIGAIGSALPESNDWKSAEVRAHALRQRDAMRIAAPAGWSPSSAVETAARALGPEIQVTVDAGAHMFPIMALWPARRPHQVLISNGLSTMGFALPSAIGAALLNRSNHVVALTGDGGLLMCLAELGTAARERLKVITIVFSDRSLSLIRIKQEKMGYAPVGMSLDGVDWLAAAKTFGLPAWRAHNDDGMTHALDEAMKTDGPSLVEAVIDSSTYPETMRALRG